MIESAISEFSRLLFEIPAILLAVGIHEYFHGIVAHRFGDDTAVELNTLNINPFPRLDLLGFLMFLWFKYGWTRHMPLDLRKIGPSKSRAVAVLLAGIAGNFLLACLFILVLKLKKPLPESFFFNFIGYSIVLNFNMVLINLLPVLPLDGGRIAALFFPKYERYEFPGAMLLVLISFTVFSDTVSGLSKAIFNLFI